MDGGISRAIAISIALLAAMQVLPAAAATVSRSFGVTTVVVGTCKLSLNAAFPRGCYPSPNPGVTAVQPRIIYTPGPEGENAVLTFEF